MRTYSSHGGDRSAADLPRVSGNSFTIMTRQMITTTKAKTRGSEMCSKTKVEAKKAPQPSSKLSNQPTRNESQLYTRQKQSPEISPSSVPCAAWAANVVP